MPAPKMIGTGRRVPRNPVFQPGERGYHGPRETALPESKADSAAYEANVRHRTQMRDRYYQRTQGIALGAGAAMYASPLLMTPFARRQQKKATAENRRKTAAIGKASEWERMTNPYSSKDPGIRQAGRHIADQAYGVAWYALVE